LLDTSRHETRGLEQARRERLLYLCDWLPPDYGAVGQYSLQFARELAAQGRDVVLAGLSSRESSDTAEPVGQGHLHQIRLFASRYDKTSILRRLMWTARINTRFDLASSAAASRSRRCRVHWKSAVSPSVACAPQHFPAQETRLSNYRFSS